MYLKSSQSSCRWVINILCTTFYIKHAFMILNFYLELDDDAVMHLKDDAQ